MPITNDSLNKKLYQLLKVQGFDPVPKDSKGNTTPVPDEAEVFRFTFKVDGKPVGPAWVTVDSNQDLKVYYDDETMGSMNEDGGVDRIDDFTEFLQQLKQWAQRRQLGFDVENQDHLESDMAQRDYMKQKEKISEGYYPMGKTASYNDSVPSVKIILQHTRTVQEGEQRFRNIAKIFLENTQGERILAPTTRPGIAKVYARHLAEGGLPHDERWGHIGSLVEEYSKMAGFVRATRNGQFNESAQQLVNEGINHYQSLRETLSKMTGHRGYNAYFESYTPPLMETEGEESALNELFVQETLDPRIESVMPILSRIHKKVNEMSEVTELAEWADSITEEESLVSNNPQGVPEGALGNPGVEDSPVSQAITRRILMQRTDLLAKYGPEKVMNAIDDVCDFVGDVEEIGSSDVSGWVKQVEQSLGGQVEESGLQAYLGNKKYGKKGMDALRKAGREHASKEKMASIRTKYDNLDEVDMGQYDAVKSTPKGKEDDEVFKKFREKVRQYGDELGQRQKEKSKEVSEEIRNTDDPYDDMVEDYLDYLESIGMLDKSREEEKANLIADLESGVTHSSEIEYALSGTKWDPLAEDLDADQKRVGQLGPTEKVKNNNIGKLVGANESFINTDAQAVVSEMDKSDDKKGPEGKATPITPKKMADDAKKILDKQKVKEGQEDLEAILRIVKK